MEVDVDEVWEHATTQGTGEIAERVRRRNRAQRPSRRQLERRKVRSARPNARRAAGREAERARGVQSTYPSSAHASATSTSAYQPPPQNSRRREPELAEPRALGEDALTGRTARRAERGREQSSACGVRAARVQRLRGHARATPTRPRPNARSAGRISAATRKPPGRAALQRREVRPDGVVERSLHVAGDDRVPFPRRGAHRARS